MAWFTYKDAQTNTFAAPVRREIFFPVIDENLKVGDWIFVSLADVNIGKVFTISGSTINESFDSDSYLVVYENAEVQTATYSLIDNNQNLYFKSLTDISNGSRPLGKYYVYYHADDIQYIQISGSDYIKTNPPSGSNFIATTNGSGEKVINIYSNEVLGNESNTRTAVLSYISSIGSWQDSASNRTGDKAIGMFNGPYLKIFGDKGPDCGTIKLKIIKTSSSGVGQKVMQEEEIDLYNASPLTDTVIYSVDTNSYTELEDYEDVFGSFSFEIEIIEKKNLASSDNRCKISKYAFSKNYNLIIRQEEIKEDIVFISTGAVR